MFIRKTKNRSGSISVQITKKTGRKNKVLKTIGIAHTPRELELLMIIARQELSALAGKQSLFNTPEDLIIDAFVAQIEQDQLHFVGPQLLLGPLYDTLGLAPLELGEYFKPLVISRLVYPGSKLKTLSYLKRHHQMEVGIDTIYRYLDHLDEPTCACVQDQVFAHSRRILGGQIGLLFYDLTTLYFEASQEDELRRIGYSKDGKSQHPQIVLGLLLGSQGYPLAYQIFEGNTGEPRTLIPMIASLQERYQISQPIIVADAALLSQKNVDALSKAGYQYILGGRLKNEKEDLKKQILAMRIQESQAQQIVHPKGRLIVAYSAKRAKKDQKNREKGLRRLENKIKSGKLSKAHLNNRGYNKYLKMEGEVDIQLDYQKFEQDKSWEGLKGYITNTDLPPKEVIHQYSQLWQIEKAFRISKTDLKIRPIYHRIKRRIQAHVCICFVAYTLYKELDRRLKLHQVPLSPEKALDKIKHIQQLTYQLPHSKQVKRAILGLSQEQKDLMKISEP